jgi:putative FmdB family regulatory protein
MGMFGRGGGPPIQAELGACAGRDNIWFRQCVRPIMGAGTFSPHRHSALAPRVMPIYEYRCRSCNHQFEALVRKQDTPACSNCGAVDLERLMSVPNVKSEITHDKAMRAARQRDQKLGTERTQEQLNYERSHND